jgi:hypothetical protein
MASSKKTSPIIKIVRKNDMDSSHDFVDLLKSGQDLRKWLIQELQRLNLQECRIQQAYVV